MEQTAAGEDEKAYLAVVDLGRYDSWTPEDQTAELTNLVTTAGADIVGSCVQRRERPDPKTYIGKGKVQDLGSLAREAGAGTVVFSEELSPSQQRNLEQLIGTKVLDRTALILDIFAQHAHTKEGKLQVELAQCRYRLPRLRGFGLAWSRTGGGIGTRGPGEQQLEYDRRVIRRRIQMLSRELEKVDKERRTQRKMRMGGAQFNVCLVGYTNAGKSSLLNRLTGSSVLVEDKLFATLDSTSRKLVLDGKRQVVLSDTVGFIHHLPHDLIAAFRSTLDEVRYADCLMQVIDAGPEHFERQISAVVEVLGEIGVAETPRIEVFNKCDLLTDEQVAGRLAKHPGSVAVSALTGTGEDELRAAVASVSEATMTKVAFRIPYSQGGIRQRVHERGRVLSEKYAEDGVHLTALMRAADAAAYNAFRVSKMVRKRSKKKDGGG